MNETCVTVLLVVGGEVGRVYGAGEPGVSWTGRNPKAPPIRGGREAWGARYLSNSFRGVSCVGGTGEERIMDILYPRRFWLDVQRRVAAVRLAGLVRSRPKFAPSIHHHACSRLSGWLGTEHGCTHVAMEATGVLEAGLAYPVLRRRRHADRWPMPRMSRTCRAARPTSGTPSGWLICWRTG